MRFRPREGALVALGLLAVPYIDWEVSARIAGWDLNVPVADLVALLALARLWVGSALRGSYPFRVGSPEGGSYPLLTGIEAAGWGGLITIGLVSAATGAGLEGAGLEGAGLEGAGLRGAGPGALHTLIRKPIFLLLAWRVGFAAVVQSTTVRGGPALVARWLTASSVLCAAVLAGSSVARILAGQTLWWASIDGFTNNHKTLAVYLAPTIPLVWTVSPVAVALIVLAIGMSWSKAAWVTAAFALGWVTLRLRLRGPVLALGTAAALLGMALLPALARSPEQIDSLRSRMSLNRRALQMFAERPWTGWGAGTNVRYEISTYPDYRVNGVDAHGVFAKLGSEFGALGVVAWLSATGALLWRFRGRRSRLDDVLLGTFLALHLSLLTSTETFSQTHWAILGLICGLAARRR